VLNYSSEDIDVIIITSSEALVHLQNIAKQAGKAWILEKPLLVIHERVARRAGELGFKLKPVITVQASEAALLDALQSMQH
jgi:uroporphyrinogen-III synthase